MRRRLSLPMAMLALGFLLTACSGAASTLNDAGTGARQISVLWWAMFGVAAAVVIVVTAMLLIGLARRRGTLADAPTLPPERERLGAVVAGGIVVPAVVLVLLFVATLGTMRAEQNLASSSTDAVTVDIVGHQWWWEVRYPGLGVVTADELHLPVGEPVRIRATSRDVIHSVWIPSLGRKIDAIPGRTTQLTLQAERAGRFRGECAEYCGLQHSHMAFEVVAESRSSFQNWVSDESVAPPAVPLEAQAQRGQEIFMSSSCVYCHTISGTNATGQVGPDLTHIGSRLTLGADTIPNTPGHLEGWILDPQGIKPGIKMPPTALTSDEIRALMAYLESLD